MSFELDHLVVAARSLDEGEAWLRERLGVPLQPGGQHPGWGTHNRLLQLGGGVYLELIAPDPSQSAPTRPRPFGLDTPELLHRLADAPQLVHWIVRTQDIDAAVRSLRYRCGPVTPMTRGTLRWRITVPVDGQPAGDGVLPTIIQWDTPSHPASLLPDQGVRLAGLRLSAPAAVLAMRPPVDADAVTIEWVAAPAGGLCARVATALGDVLIGEPAAG